MRHRRSAVAVAIIGLAGLAGSSVATVSAAAPVPAPASVSAQSGTYKGKTRDDGRVSFRLSGKRVSGVRGIVPAVCLELGGSYDSRIGYEVFRPPGRFTLGRTRKVKAVQPATLNGNEKATKTYTVTMRSAGSRLVKGRLKVSYVFLTVGFPDVIYLWNCSGSVTFTARRV
jgi:hypothetical protein